MPITTNDDAIAIIGVGCITPGADNLDEFWRLLEKGENHVIDIPPERWNVNAYYSPDSMTHGKTYVKRAGLVRAPDEWDNRLFGINDFEANQADPQQRMVLDCTHMAMEDAGLTRQQLQGSNTGVYVGSMSSDYRGLFTSSSTIVGNYTATGISNSIISARVSYVYDLRGPSMTIDTACSSALVSVHLGAQAIRAGDCEVAICGGTNYLTLPDVFVHLSKSHMLSPTGQCHAFSDKADGYTRGEGCGILILKRLKDAIRDGDNIWSTVLTGSNQDGRTVSPMTAPSMEQQTRLMEQIYSSPAIDVDRLDYIEAHGTGTPAGDPIEANAVGNFFKDHSTVSRTRFIGTVKSNLGHLESAAGAVGMIKVLLMMKHSKIVPSLHFSNNNPNPRIDFDDLQLQVPTEVIPWLGENKVACASSFGFGGTNSHAVMMEYTPPRSRASTGSVPAVDTVEEDQQLESLEKKPCIVCFSANSDKSLQGSLDDFLRQDLEHLDLNDVSYTSTVRRDHFTLRLAKVVRDVPELRRALQDHLESGRKAANALRKPRVVFVFCGMGTGWRGMGKELMAEWPLFREKVEEVSSQLAQHVSWSLMERLEEESHVDDPEFSPLAIFAMQVALAAAWQSLGVQPQCIVGQSVGEVAAAHVAGCLTFEDAVKVIYWRTHHLATVTGGRMIIVRNMEESKVTEVLREHEGKASIALHYSPKACAISGDADNVAAIKSSLLSASKSQDKQVQIVDLQVPVAYHSHHVDDCCQPLEQSLQDLDPSEPTIPLVSSVTGQAVTEAPDVQYWVNNMRQPVLFHQAVTKATEPKTKNVFIEIGPKPVLRAHLPDIFTKDEPHCLVSMAKKPEQQVFLNAVASLYELGADLEWDQLPTRGRNVTCVPRYSFNRQKSLALSEAGVTILAGVSSMYRKHAYVFPIEKEFRLIAMISPHGQTSLYDHVVSGVIVVPGAFYAEVGLGVAAHLSTAKLKWAIGVDFEQPLVIQRDSVLKIDVEFAKGLPDVEKTKAPIKLTKDGKVLATLRLTSLGPVDATLTPVVNLAHIQGRCKTRVNKEEIYASLARFGFQYGEGFSLITTALKSDTECLATMRLPAFIKDELVGLYIHPSILDSMLQSAVVLMSNQNDVSDLLPRSINWLVVHRQVEDVMLIHTKLKQAGRKETIYDVTLTNTHGIVIAELEGLVIRSITEGRVGLDDMYNCDWKEISQVPSVYSVDASEGQDIVFITDRVPTVEIPEWMKKATEAARNGEKAEEAMTGEDKNEEAVKDEEKAEEEKQENEKDANTEKALALMPKANKEIVCQYSLSDQNYHHLPDSVEEALKQEDVSAIALMCLTPFDDSDDSETLQEKISNVCFLIRSVMMRAADLGHVAPLYVCTSKAWPSPEHKTSSHTVNPLMTAIWGMTRCALREQLYPNLITVEVQVPEGQLSVDFLQRALAVVGREKALQDYPELLVTGSAVYVNQMVQVESETLLPTYRQLHADSDKSALLLCQDASMTSRPFAIFHEPKVDSATVPTKNGKNGKAETELVTVKTESLALHHPKLFSMSVQYEDMAAETLSASKERGCPVFSMEVVGTSLQDPEDRIVSFYPVAVGTQVTVPRFATINTSSLPGYQVGDLTKLMVLWTLQQQVQTPRVTLLTSARTRHLSGLLEGLLQQRKVDKKTAAVEVVDVEELDGDVTLLDTVLSLVYVDGKVVSSLAKRWDQGKAFVTCQGMLSSEGRSALAYFLPGVLVQVLSTDDAFHPRRLQTLLPAMKKWLKKLNGHGTRIMEALHSGFPASVPPGIVLPESMTKGEGGAMPELPPGITLDMIPPEMLPPGLVSPEGMMMMPDSVPPGMMPPGGMPPEMMSSGGMPPGMMPPGMMPPGGMPPGMMPPGGMPPGMMPPGGMPPGMMPPGGMPPGGMPPGMMPPGGMPPGMMPPGGMPPGMMPPGGMPGGMGAAGAMDRRQWASALAVLNPRTMSKRPAQAADLNQLLHSDKKDLDNVLVHANSVELFRSDSVYLVIGGLTGLGWVVVKYLAQQGAGAVAIVNRRSPNSDQLEKIRVVMEETDTQIQTFQADVTSFSSVQALMQSVTAAFPTFHMKGVFYGAAVIDDSILLNMDPDKFNKVLSPKVKGVWNFHQLTKHLPLDYFVMHSSITSIVGNPGQTHYGAGNAFMDGVAYYRKALGLAAQSINWGALDLGILDTNSAAKQMLEAQGFVLMTKADVREILTPILMLDWPQITPSKFDKEKMATRIQRDMLVYLEKRLQSLMPKNMASMRIDNQILQNVQNARHMEPEKRKEVYRTYITALACQVLSIDQSMVTDDANLIELGMDSISAMTMISQIASQTQVRLPAILFVSGEPSPQSIAQAISDAVDGKLDVTDDGEQTLKIEELEAEEAEEDQSTPVSPIEAQQLDWYKKTTRKQSMHNTVDIPIPPQHANLASVRAAIFTVLAKHPSTRSVFNESHSSKSKIKRAILNPEEIFDLHVVEGGSQKSMSQLRELSEEPFDSQKSGPVRFIFTEKPTPTLRLVLHKVGFDLISTSVLVQDLVDGLDKTYVPDEQLALAPIPEYKEVDDLKAGLEKLYKEKSDEFFRFWERLGSKKYGVTTLKDRDTPTLANSMANGMVCLPLKPVLVNKLNSFIQDHKTFLLGVVVSCHQVLLHALTGKKTIPVIFPLDLRKCFDHLGNMGSYCNEIPLVAEFHTPYVSVREFILSNSKTIESHIKHGVLPFSMFGDVSDRILSLFSDTPHSVSIEKLEPGSLSTGLRHNAVVLPSNSETHLTICHDLATQSVVLTLAYRGSALDRHKATKLLKNLRRLLKVSLASSKFTVANVQSSCKKLRSKLQRPTTDCVA